MHLHEVNQLVWVEGHDVVQELLRFTSFQLIGRQGFSLDLGLKRFLAHAIRTVHFGILKHLRILFSSLCRA